MLQESVPFGEVQTYYDSLVAEDITNLEGGKP